MESYYVKHLLQGGTPFSYHVKLILGERLWIYRFNWLSNSSKKWPKFLDYGEMHLWWNFSRTWATCLHHSYQERSWPMCFAFLFDCPKAKSGLSMFIKWRTTFPLSDWENVLKKKKKPNPWLLSPFCRLTTIEKCCQRRGVHRGAKGPKLGCGVRGDGTCASCI